MWKATLGEAEMSAQEGRQGRVRGVFGVGGRAGPECQEAEGLAIFLLT